MAVFTSDSESQEILLPQQQQQQQGEKTIIPLKSEQNHGGEVEEEEEEEVIVWKPQEKTIKKPKKRVPQVCLEGYVEPTDEDEIPRTKSLTDDDLDELKGCVDLGFGFSYDEIPELCNTLPALELCYSMSQKFLDDQQIQQQSNGNKNGGSGSDTASSSGSESSSPMPTWKISSPGDHPEDVKARLKFWAQAVACTVRLCS